MNDEKVRQLSQRAQTLGKLKQHESWAELRQLFEERRKRHFDSMTKRLLAGQALDQRLIDRTAGFFRGAQWLLDNPEMAEQSLESALRKAELLGREEAHEHRRVREY